MAFLWRRDVPETWAHDLGLIAPRVERASHLVLFWESGTPVDPIQRWVVYQATPAEYVPDYIEALLLCPPWVSPGRARIYDYLQDTGCLARPYWVVQGHRGGHKYRHDDTDRRICASLGLPPDPPSPGDLAYAPYDTRVARRLLSLDLARQGYGTLAGAEAAVQSEAEREMRRAQVIAYGAEAQDAITDTYRGIPDDAVRRPHGSVWDHVDDDRVDAEYVDTGALTLPPGVVT